MNIFKHKSIVLSLLLSTLFSCTAPPIKEGMSYTEWDFDHDIQYSITKLSQKRYLLEIETRRDLIKSQNSKIGTNFERGSAFLIRKSLSLCKGYHFTLEVIKGVEGVNDKEERPNLMFGALTAKVNCQN